MALNKRIEELSGISGDYIKAVGISVNFYAYPDKISSIPNASILRYELYRDAEARTGGKAPIAEKSISILQSDVIGANDKDIYATMYRLLKAQFPDSVDC